ncbi:MAG TPA: dihydrolipoamide acetyltransferase family protein, partial [Pseudonocardia sp.]|uniref:dihydrolipoamide acetyltransferase family protein n=1 Tax=Pseudonocardia sp. TaxID=60912 RepID=UPI002C791287
VETAKALVEVPSPYAGVIARLHGAEGSTIAVGAPLIEVDPAGNGSAPALAPAGNGAVTATPEAASYVEEERAGSGNVLIGYGTSEEPATGRRRVRRGSTSNSPPDRPVPDRPVPDRPVPDRPVPDRPVLDRPAADRPRVKSPLVRQLARREGVDLGGVVGSGPTGLITRADVERATASVPAVIEPDPPSPEGTDRRTGLPARERIPLRGVRKVIADTLLRSRTEIPEATTWVDVDVTELIELRASLATGDQRPPSLLAFLARFAVAGLRVFPELNARVDTERGEIVQWDGVNLGIATQTDRGLMVPAVAGADRLSVRAIDAEIRRVTEAARSGTASSGELTRGSFTLNNYGVFGVDGSAAIINYPEVAILGIGRIIQRPWVVDGAVVPRHIGQLSLVFDHRACDGAASGGFLRHVADAVEHPLSALVDS